MTAHMKHFLAYLLIVCLVLLPLASCASESSNGTDTSSESVSESVSVSDTESGTESDSPGDDESSSESESDSESESESLDPLPVAEPNIRDAVYTGEAGDISIDGVPLTAYRIVIPQNADLYTQMAARNLSEYLQYNAGYTLETVTDETPEADYELVIGATNRAGSSLAMATTLAADEYILFKRGTGIYMYGNNYMVAAGAAQLINRLAAPAWQGQAVDITRLPTEPTAIEFVFDEAENAILLIGDGMGRNHVEMTLTTGLSHFAADDMPYRGEIITRSQSVIDYDSTATDSAAAGTAMASGYKTLNGRLGLDAYGRPTQTLRELANAAGCGTAILSTDQITGATPVSFLVHIESRDEYNDIYKEISNLMKAGEVDFVEGDVGDKLLDRSAHALQSISARGAGFFAMMEEGLIDKFSHNNIANGVTASVKRFNDLIAYSMVFALFHPNTMVIVVADHETGGLTYGEPTDGSTITTEAVNGYNFTSGAHTNINVPIYAMGSGTEYFDNTTRENVTISSLIAALYTDDAWGDPAYHTDETDT